MTKIAMKIAKKIIVWAIVLGALGYGIYAIATSPKITEEEIVSNKGLHWHARLSIKINGEEIAIPTNIGVNGVTGIGGDPMELHTHAEDGIIHAEFTGLITKEQLTLKNFFEVWGKDFSKDSILGHKADDGHIIKMFVDGKENFEFENYSINGIDDKIEEIQIVYE